MEIGAVDIGSSNKISDSFNEINIISAIDTQLSIIRREFFEGKIGRAFNDIVKAREEHKGNEKARYQLLALETLFDFTLRNFEKTKDNLAYIDKNLAKHRDEIYYQMWASIYALDCNRDAFDRTVEVLKKEFNGNSNPSKYFELIYLLNSKQTMEAKELCENLLAANQALNLEAVIGNIFANIYINTGQYEFFEKAELIYDKYLSSGKANFFEKLEMYQFSSFYSINNLLTNQYNEQCNIKLKQTKEILESIYDDFKYFASNYRQTLQSHYLHCLFFIDKNQFSDIFKIINADEIDIVNFIFYYIDSDCKAIEHDVIKERILQKNEQEILVQYLNILVKKQPSMVIDFISDNKQYLDNEIVLNLYLEAQANENIMPNETVFSMIKNRKDNSLISFITYLEVMQLTHKKIDNEEMAKLIDSIGDENIQPILIIKAIALLSQNNKQKDYLDLAIKYANIHPVIIKEILLICQQDKDLLLLDFDNFINAVDNIENSIIIGNTYLQYRSLDKAYSFYRLAWDNLELSNSYKVNFALSILQNCTIQNFLSNNGSIIDSQQDKIYKSYIECNYESLTIEQCAILSYYLIAVEKAFDLGFQYINRKLLGTDIHKLDDRQKELLSHIYFYTIIERLEETIITKHNIVIKKECIFYISKNCCDEISSSNKFILKNQESFDLLSYDENIEKTSIYHQLCNIFISTMKSEHFHAIKYNLEDPLGNIKDFLHKQATEGKDAIKAYSDGENVPFYRLSNHSYENYFNLIPQLLESNDINFNAGFNNPQPKSVNKILTFSSILLLEHLNMLDTVLTRDDIFIQKTTSNWLTYFIKSLDNQKEILKLHSDGENLYKNIADEKTIKQSQKYLLALATKIINHGNFVNDENEIFALKDSMEILAPTIGIQEYRALAFAYNNGYQVISEDRIFNVFLNILGLNASLVSNSISLINNELPIDRNDLIAIYKNLSNKKYKHIFNKQTTLDTINRIIFEYPTYAVESLKNSDLIGLVVSSAHEYGWMEEIEKFYEQTYIFKPPMSNRPERDAIAKNIECLLDLDLDLD